MPLHTVIYLTSWETNTSSHNQEFHSTLL